MIEPQDGQPHLCPVDELLSLLFNAVNHSVVSDRIHHVVFVHESNVIFDIALQTEDVPARTQTASSTHTQREQNKKQSFSSSEAGARR